MISETLVFFVYIAAAVGLVVLLGCVMTLASIVVGDPDPLAWAKVIGQMFSDAAGGAQQDNERQSADGWQREYERQRDEYQRTRPGKPAA
jgi:hypothetical protein